MLQIFVVASMALMAGAVHAAPSCSQLGYNNVPQAKSNKLYLYFPPADDAAFPEFGVAGQFTTSPAHKFDVAELVSYLGTAPQLREAIVDVVTDDYCEFNVEVIVTTSLPPSTFLRRNTVAIGTDSLGDPGTGEQWRQAQLVDTNDQTLVDFARVWAGTYQAGAGQPGGALEGGNSTVERWARSIGGTVAHEAAHNYGLMHSDGHRLAPGEDVLKHHLMAEGAQFDNEDRAGYRRHFSDNEYSMLAQNVGLSVQTMFNWDFVNPNAETAFALQLDFLSLQSSLTLASVYTGSASPWVSPTLVPRGTATFKGDTYNLYRITWSTGQAWNGVTPGQVPGGGSFHVGASFNSVDFNLPDPIIITNASLLDSSTRGSTPLNLHPRVPGFDAGALSPMTGSFLVTVTNFQATPLLVEAAKVQFLPRLVSIDSLVRGAARLLDPFGMPVTIWSEKRVKTEAKILAKDRQARLEIANLREGRRIVNLIDATECSRRDAGGKRPDTAGCKTGIQVSLFPATSTLLTVTVVDPKAKQWDPEKRKYVVGPLRTTIYYQLVGRRPDLNRNGIDDYVDIVTGRAKDRNGDWLIFPLPRGR